MQIENITAEHRAVLEAFVCATEGSEASQLVERAIRTEMPSEIEKGCVEGLAFREVTGEISAVVFFTRGPDLWRVHFLATDLRGFRRRKRALRLKRRVIEMATQAGANAVSSVVDQTNGPMLELNRRWLKAVCVPKGDGLVVCTVRLAGARSTQGRRADR